MISVNEEVKEIKITEDMYIDGNYTLNIKNSNTPQKYLINAENVKNKNANLSIYFYQPIIAVSGWGGDSISLNSLNAGFGTIGTSDISMKAGFKYSISIFNGVVVYSYDIQEI